MILLRIHFIPFFSLQTFILSLPYYYYSMNDETYEKKKKIKQKQRKSDQKKKHSKKYLKEKKKEKRILTKVQTIRGERGRRRERKKD